MWTGYDCSKQMCPFGDYLGRFAETSFEQQRLLCHHRGQSTFQTDGYIGGSFKLSFRNAVTDDIPFNASTETLKAALEALPTIGSVRIASVSVEYSCICQISSTDNYIDIEFTSEVT